MPLVVFAGRFVRYKGCDVLLQALKEVQAAAVFAGDGPLKDELTAQGGVAGPQQSGAFSW